MTQHTSPERWWTMTRGPGPVIATAIHDGHDVRPEVGGAMMLPDLDRLREEDPYTGQAVTGVPTHIIAHRSRFEFDLNRGPDSAVYRTPEQSWGLRVWRGEPSDKLVADSLELHSAYYRMLGALLDDIAAAHDQFVVIDVHSYNHRRDGPDGAATAQDKAPDVNIGTISMPRDHWAFMLDPLMEEMRSFDFNGRQLDVRENIAFQGKGEQTRFIHDRYPRQGCAIALEFKKFFMDEWSGEPDPAELAAMREFITWTGQRAAQLLAR
ncbi:MAG: N-formylglutamate amidohydrolase [Sphingomicrobium sp.]